MSFQPQGEKDAERQLITDFAAKIGAKVIKLQDDDDDCGTDGVIDYNGKHVNVEARRKGFPLHNKPASRKFIDGWKSECLVSGIFLNESTIRNYIGKSFVYIVEIKGYKPRFCVIDSSRVEELLKQPRMFQPSANSGNSQPVKRVPLNWFSSLSGI